MYGEQTDTERIRNVHSFDPEHPRQRTTAGAVTYVGLLAAGVLAMSYPIGTTVAIGIVGGTVWSGLWLVDRSGKANAPFVVWNERGTSRERPVVRIPGRGQR